MNWIEFDDDDIRCPFCKSSMEDRDDIYPFDDHDELAVTCKVCRKKFLISQETKVTYFYKIDCDLNNEKHAWDVKDALVALSEFRRCVACGKMEQLRWVPVEEGDK